VIAYITLTYLLYTLYPFDQGLRYLFPILPFYFSFVLSSLEKYAEAGGAGPERWARRVICVLPVVLVLLYLGNASTVNALDNLAHGRGNRFGPFTETSTSMFSYIRENTAEDSVIIFFKPRAMRMMTGRRSLMITRVGELSRGDYVGVYRPGEESDDLDQISPGSVRCLTETGALRPVYANRDFVVYRRTEAREHAVHPDNDCAAPVR
jgi:hypothetical protein